MSAFFCIVLPYVGGGPALSQFIVQGVIPHVKGSTVSELILNQNMPGA